MNTQQSSKSNVVKMPVKKGRIANMKDLDELVDIVKILEDFTGEDFSQYTGSFNMPCPIKDHKHTDPSKRQFVVGGDAHNVGKCMSRDEAFNVWKLTEKLYGIDFRRAVHKVADICGVRDQIEYEESETMNAEDREEERQQKAEEAIKRIMDRSKRATDDDDVKQDADLALFEMFGIWVDESEYKKDVIAQFLYDPDQESLAVIENKPAEDDEDKWQVVNIRHVERFQYDKATKQFLDARQPGKWFSLPNCKSCRAYTNMISDDGPIFVVEGVKDRLAAELLGLDHVGLTSVGSFNSFNQEELESLFSERDVIIYPDNDQAAQKMAATASEKLADIAKRVRVISWAEMVDKPKKGYDLADFVKEANLDYDDLRQVMIDPDTRIRQRMMQQYKIQKADVSGDMRTFDERKQDFTNCSFMPVRKNTVSLLVAPGGTGKTFFMLYFLLRFILDERKPAMMFASEENYFELMDRLRRIIQVTIGLEGDERQEAEKLVNEYLCVAPCESNFGSIQREGTFGYEIDESKVSVIEQLVKPFELVVLDPLITFFGGPENDNGAARTFMNVFLKLANDHHKTVLIVHHSTKDKTSSRGASAFVDAARAVYELHEVSEMDYKKMKEEAKGKIEFAPVSYYRDLVVTKDNYNCKAYLSNKGEHLVATLPNGLRFKLF